MSVNNERGAPAFDNIDDILADKIIRHSRTHSGSNGKSSLSQDATRPAGPQETPSSFAANSSLRWIAAAIAGILFTMLLIAFFRRCTRVTAR
jgi:hypothetical protein